MALTIEILALLLIIAFIAGWVDTVAGGGGLITIPTLILAGVSPESAIATNKLQGSVGTFTAAAYFSRKKTVSLSRLKWAMLATFCGSVFGSWLLLKIDSDTLVIFLPILLIAIGSYFLFSSNVSDEERKEKLTLVLFALTVCPLLGLYDGFFGPGTGSMMALAFVVLLGFSLAKATANAKILNFVSNISSLGYFILFGDINFIAGLVMMLGQFFGALMGARMVLKNGSKLIKPVVVIACFVMSVSLLLNP